MNISSVGIGTVFGNIRTVIPNVKKQEKPEKSLLSKEENSEIADYKRQIEDQTRASQVSAIYGKMLAGGKLSEEELVFLRENSPDNYEKALQLEREREMYKKELAQCQSKEDVEKLNQRKLSQMNSEARAIAGNPNIPKGKKKELIEFIGMRMNAYLKEYAGFKSSEEYKQLPDMAENMPDVSDYREEEYIPSWKTDEKISLYDSEV